MTFDLKNLELNKEYDFDVVVEDGDSRFAGKLTLTPKKITITVMGEQSEDRKCSIGWNNLDKIICHNLNQKFFLYDLKFISGRGSAICHQPKQIKYFESTLEVGFIIFFPSGCFETSFLTIGIHSETISCWIGDTETQEEILRSYHNKENIFEQPDKLVEFIIDIKDVGRLGISYNLSANYSSPDFKSEVLFPPSLNIVLYKAVDAKTIYNIFNLLKNLFIFLTGDELVIEKIDIGHLGSGFGVNSNGSLYYASKAIQDRHQHSTILFPLGRNLRFDYRNLPPLPLEIFNNYFSLKDTEIGHFGKYIKYKRMENVEERFLGFFRILETLSFKQKEYLEPTLLSELCERAKPYLIKKFKNTKSVNSFLRGIPRYNNSKYNTEKCVQDFFKTIPHELSNKWKFKKQDIGSICKLRNDITHANDYYIKESKIEENAKFIETLLVLALCLKIGLDLETTSQFIPLMNGYHQIVTRNQNE